MTHPERLQASRPDKPSTNPTAIYIWPEKGLGKWIAALLVFALLVAVGVGVLAKARMDNGAVLDRIEMEGGR